MSDILNGGHTTLTDSNQHLSNGAYQNMLNKESARAMANNQLQQQLYGVNTQANQQGVSTYRILTKWQEYADLIEHRFKDGSDVANSSSDSDTAYSVMTSASMRERAIDVAVSTSSATGVFFIGALFVSVLPLLIKDPFDAIFLSVVVFCMAFGFTYFYQYVFIQTRQFVIGPTTRKLFKTMLNGYESFKSSVYVLSAIIFSALTYLSTMTTPAQDDGYFFFTFYNHLGHVGVEYYLTHVALFLFANILILKMLEDMHYKRFRELARKHTIEMDMNMSVAADVGLKRLSGDYQADKFASDE